MHLKWNTLLRLLPAADFLAVRKSVSCPRRCKFRAETPSLSSAPGFLFFFFRSAIISVIGTWNIYSLANIWSRSPSKFSTFNKLDTFFCLQTPVSSFCLLCVLTCQVWRQCERYRRKVAFSSTKRFFLHVYFVSVTLKRFVFFRFLLKTSWFSVPHSYIIALKGLVQMNLPRSHCPLDGVGIHARRWACFQRDKSRLWAL